MSFRVWVHHKRLPLVPHALLNPGPCPAHAVAALTAPLQDGHYHFAAPDEPTAAVDARQDESWESLEEPEAVGRGAAPSGAPAASQVGAAAGRGGSCAGRRPGVLAAPCKPPLPVQHACSTALLPARQQPVRRQRSPHTRRSPASSCCVHALFMHAPSQEHPPMYRGPVEEGEGYKEPGQDIASGAPLIRVITASCSA